MAMSWDSYLAKQVDEHYAEPDVCSDCNEYEPECTCDYSMSSRKEDDELERKISAAEDRAEQEAEMAMREYDGNFPPNCGY